MFSIFKRLYSNKLKTMTNEFENENEKLLNIINKQNIEIEKLKKNASKKNTPKPLISLRNLDFDKLDFDFSKDSVFDEKQIFIDWVSKELFGFISLSKDSYNSIVIETYIRNWEEGEYEILEDKDEQKRIVVDKILLFFIEKGSAESIKVSQ